MTEYLTKSISPEIEAEFAAVTKARAERKRAGGDQSCSEENDSSGAKEPGVFAQSIFRSKTDSNVPNCE